VSSLARFLVSCAALSSACSGEYWLGGSLGASGAAGTSSLGDAGVTYELDGDVVLSGDAGFIRDGTSGGCTLIGNGHTIRSVDPWTGSFLLRNCRVVGLGTESTPAIELSMSAGTSATIEGCTFESSGMIHILNQGDSTTVIRGNVVAASSVVRVFGLRNDSSPAFLFDGWDGTGQKVFQGNRIERSYLSFASATHWLIGGDTDAESNLLVGLRAGINLNGTDLVVRGNYVHDLFARSAELPNGNEESALSVAYESGPVLCEHNVLRHGHWVVRSFGGEMRYNAVLDADETAFIQQPLDGAKIHHNLFTMYAAPGEEGGLVTEVQSGIALINSRTTGIEIWSNTFDGGGAAKAFTGPVISVDDSSFLDSLRNNAFVRFPLTRNDGTEAVVRPWVTEGIDPEPPRLGYTDYNLFNNPEAQSPRVYALSVAGKQMRLDAGFGLNDAQPNGPVDQQVDPAFSGPLPSTFPWADDDILARRVTISQMLAAWRALYAPAPGSPLTDRGDPADGVGTDIGAVGAGDAHPLDEFGKFGK
jgi:hypothetical protein